MLPCPSWLPSYFTISHLQISFSFVYKEGDVEAWFGALFSCITYGELQNDGGGPPSSRENLVISDGPLLQTGGMPEAYLFSKSSSITSEDSRVALLPLTQLLHFPASVSSWLLALPTTIIGVQSEHTVSSAMDASGPTQVEQPGPHCTPSKVRQLGKDRN